MAAMEAALLRLRPDLPDLPCLTDEDKGTQSGLALERDVVELKGPMLEALGSGGEASQARFAWSLKNYRRMGRDGGEGRALAWLVEDLAGAVGGGGGTGSRVRAGQLEFLLVKMEELRAVKGGAEHVSDPALKAALAGREAGLKYKAPMLARLASVQEAEGRGRSAAHALTKVRNGLRGGDEVGLADVNLEPPR